MPSMVGLKAPTYYFQHTEKSGVFFWFLCGLCALI